MARTWISPSICHIASRVCSMTSSNPSSRGDGVAVVEQPGAVDAAGAAGAGVDAGELVEQPSRVAQRRVGEGQQVVAERRRLGLLQVGLVGHPGVGVCAPRRRPCGRRASAAGLDEVEQLVAEVDPQGDPRRLPAGPAGVQPAGVVAESGRRRSARGSCRARRTPGRRGSPRRRSASPRAAAAAGRRAAAPRDDCRARAGPARARCRRG